LGSSRTVHELSWLWILSHFTREDWPRRRTDKDAIEQMRDQPMCLFPGGFFELPRNREAPIEATARTTMSINSIINLPPGVVKEPIKSILELSVLRLNAESWVMITQVTNRR